MIPRILAVLVGLLITASLVLIVFKLGAIVRLMLQPDDRGSSDSYTLSQQSRAEHGADSSDSASSSV